MTQSQFIRDQLADSIIDNSKVDPLAGIEFSKLEKIPLAIDGTNGMLADLNVGGFKAINMAAPVAPTDGVNLAYLEARLAGLDIQGDVLDKQTDATLDPGASPTNGNRYIITDAASLNANFGTINTDLLGNAATLENNDIVQYSTSQGKFVVAYDVSTYGPGALAWNIAEGYWERWNGATWDTFGGLAGITAGAGLSKSGNVLNVNIDGSTLAIDGQDSIGLAVLGANQIYMSIGGQMVGVQRYKQEVLGGGFTGLTYTLAAIPVGQAYLDVSFNGQDLYYTEDYTLSGAVFTSTRSSIPAESRWIFKYWAQPNNS